MASELMNAHIGQVEDSALDLLVRLRAARANGGLEGIVAALVFAKEAANRIRSDCDLAVLSAPPRSMVIVRQMAVAATA